METDVEDDGKESQNQLAQMLLLHNYPSLRWSTHPSFCCISRPQPMYVPLTNHKKISMYSNWRTSPHNANPAGLSTDTLLSMYCSREHQNPEFIQAGGTSTKEGILTHSSYWTFTGQKNVAENKAMDTTDERQLPDEKEKGKQDALKLVKGGHKSFDSYTYVRGRGRGKYVCNECGIRCKKPSMLKKHIRSHTNLRPYKCRHCHLSFKTKGNLTKHMNTKSHHRRCLDQGIFPVPTQVDDSQIDPVALSAQFELSKKARIILKGGEVMPLDLTGVDEESDEEDGENAEEDNGELDGSKDSETMSATEVSALEEDMRMEIEEAVPKSEELHTERSSCIHSVGSGLVGSVPVICSTIQSQALMVSVVTTANQSSSSSDGQQQMTSTILSNGKSDPRSLGTVYGFGDTHVEVIDSEVAKSLLALSKEEEEKNKKGYDSAVNTGDETTVESSDCIQIGETTGKDLLSSSTVECPESRIEDQNYSGEFQTNCDVTVKGEEEDVNKTTDTEAPRLENSSQNSVASNKLNFKESDITFTIPLGGYMPTMGTSHVRKSGNKPSNLGPIVGQLVRQRPITLQLNNLANTPTCQSTPLHIPFQFQHPFPESSAEIPVVDNIEISSTSSEAPADVPIENEIQVNLVLVTDVPNLSQTVPVLQEEKPSTGSMTEYKVQVENDTVQHAIEPSGTASVQVIAGPSTEKPLVLSGDNGTYKCNMCGKTFSEQQHLILHRKIHFMEPTYSCSVCGNRYRTHQQCKVHCDNHNKNPTHIFATKENPRPFRCTECNIGFRTRFHLSRHFKSRLHVYKLEELKIIPQGTYGYVEEILYTLDSYSSEGFLKLLLDNLKERNIMEKLKESEQLVSEVRRRRSSHDITAKVALPVDYNEEEDDVLIIEDESSKSSSVDNNVENVSHFEPQNTSTRVEKMRDNELHVEAENPRAEFQKNELASNDKVTVEIKHEQYEMGDIFGTKAKSDDEEGESSEVHLCVICNRGFINLQHLKNHMISHAELRPYVCEYCDAGFTKAQSLKTHLQSHAQERPYVCGMCGDTFAGSESLKLHNKEKHSMKVDPVSMRDEETKAQLPMKCMDAESAKSDTMDIQTEGVVVNFTISKDEGKEDAVDLESKGDEDQSQQHEGEGQGEEYMETKIESKSPSSVSDRMIFQGEGSQYSSYQVEGFCSIQKMELGEEINIELNTEYEEMEEEDLQGKLKNDPVLARVGENDDDKQPNFSDNSSDGYFNQSDDVTHEEHEFKDPML